MECNCDSILFDTVKEAMQDINITLTTKDVTSLLIWRDLISPVIKYNKIRPWQIINRIPFSNVLCLKVSLSIILKEGQSLFPELIDFMPETFILPEEFESFEKEILKIKQEAENEAKLKKEAAEAEAVTTPQTIQTDILYKQSNSSCNDADQLELEDDDELTVDDEIEVKNEFEVKDEFFIKPSNGSLGNGIKILKTGEMVDRDSYCGSKRRKKVTENQQGPRPAVAQKYIRSHLINDTKFDLRVYVLVSSVDPFEIFVYRDGLARFCSVKSNIDSIYARITNVSMNKHSFYCKHPEEISKLISDVFDENFTEEQQKKIWSEIDDLIVLTLFCSHPYLSRGQQQFLPNYFRGINGDKSEICFYSKSFQIFGFDILLREVDLKPFLIEVNYRPSLEFLRNCERRMKVDMLKSAMKIAAPYETFQSLVKARNWSWSLTLWEEELNSHPELFQKALELKNEAIEESKFDRIWPFSEDQIAENPQKFQKFSEALTKLDQIQINQQLVKI